MIITIWCVLILYALILLGVVWQWGNIPEQVDDSHSAKTYFFSILIPIRNEESNIGALLKNLDAQNYPKEKYEVLVINDHSSDESAQVVDELKKELSCSIRLEHLPEEKMGKKAALNHGIEHAEGTVIVTIDGDCQVHKNWLSTFNIAFQDSSIKMAFGVVSYITSNKVLEVWQAMESSVLVVIGAVMNRMGLPSMCNGANLAFDKKKFLELRGYQGNEHIPSGDDEFLLRKFHKDDPESILFVKSKENIVRTNPVNTWGEFIHQKMRWASKWRQHKDWSTWLMAFFVFMVNLVFMVAIILALRGNLVLAGLYSIKVLADVLLITRVTRWLNNKQPLLLAVIFSIVYPIYAVVVGLLGTLGKYQWKERKY